MRENKISRWVVRLAIAGSIGTGALAVSAAPALAGAPVSGVIKTVTSTVTVDSVHTTSKAGTPVRVQDVVWD